MVGTLSYMKFEDLILQEQIMYTITKFTAIDQKDGDYLIIVDYDTEFGHDTLQYIENNYKQGLEEHYIDKCFKLNGYQYYTTNTKSYEYNIE